MSDVPSSGRRVLEIERLSVALPSGADRPNALQDVSFSIDAGEVFCLVGESGSGKSMTASALLGLLPEHATASGRVVWQGETDLLRLPPRELTRWRGQKIGMIFQEPMTALNPLKTIGNQIAEMFEVHTPLSGRVIRDRVLALLEAVKLPDPSGMIRRYPHQLSGGQRQRAMIAMALALEPALLIADEPTTALDVTTQAQILSLIRDLQQRTDTAVLFITHDFGVVADIADKVGVLHRGLLVESGDVERVLQAPQHAYTLALLSAVPGSTVLDGGNGHVGVGAAPATLPQENADAAPVPYLTVRDAYKQYASPRRLRRSSNINAALEHISVDVFAGRTLGVVGESGSGKTTLARAIMRLIALDGGKIALAGTDIHAKRRRPLPPYTQQVQMVFQDPFASLNPRRRVGDIVTQGPIAHGISRGEADKRARILFEKMGLNEASLNRYPHAFSGGQRQRIALARALAVEPSLLVADEPVSALDVRVQAQVLALLKTFKQERGLTMLFITHDLRVAADLCDDIAVMQSGSIVEYGPVDRVLRALQHPYTRTLLASIPGARNGYFSHKLAPTLPSTAAKPAWPSRIAEEHTSPANG